MAKSTSERRRGRPDGARPSSASEKRSYETAAYATPSLPPAPPRSSSNTPHPARGVHFIERRVRPRVRDGRIRFAVVGLGYFAQAAILPAFRYATNARLVALVSDDITKRRVLGMRYGASITTDYDGYSALLHSGKIDAVYLAVPNDKHIDFALPAMKAGIHVLCEKPLAMTPHECNRMIRSAKRHGVKLMVGYRLHFEAANLAAAEAVRRGRIGSPRIFNSTFTMQVKPGNIRTLRERGGGPLYDIGVYPINAARAVFRSDPQYVTARTVWGKDRHLGNVEETVCAILEFPGERIATFTCSFATAGDTSRYTVHGTRGQVTLDPAYEFSKGLGFKLKAEGRKTVRHTFPKRDQVTPELMHFAQCIQRDKEPEPSGLEGRMDVAILKAIRKSSLNGKRIRVGERQKDAQPTVSQVRRVPPHEMPQLVHASAPSR